MNTCAVLRRRVAKKVVPSTRRRMSNSGRWHWSGSSALWSGRAPHEGDFPIGFQATGGDDVIVFNAGPM